MKAIGSLSPGLRAEIERIAARRGEPAEIIAGVVVAVRSGADVPDPPELTAFRELAQRVVDLGVFRDAGTEAARAYREAVTDLNRAEAALLAAGFDPGEIESVLESVTEPATSRNKQSRRTV